ncbi:MAG TPA: hypothetical protein VFQ94_04990, partial [Gallionella sp.]|nr:hypothetical protein [Gallionella sp.]
VLLVKLLVNANHENHTLANLLVFKALFAVCRGQKAFAHQTNINTSFHFINVLHPIKYAPKMG